MSLIPFPSIPKLPGVPSIPRSPNFPPLVQAGLGLIQGALWSALQSDTRWGIFDQSGNPLANPSQLTGVTADIVGALGFGTTYSTSSVDYQKAVQVSDFPIEKGSFANYNKVELPGEPSVILALSGTENDRAKFLSEIDKACKSVDLYNVVTPEATYKDYSLVSYRYGRHQDHGATLLVVELMLREIRQVSAQYVNSSNQSDNVNKPKNPDATPTTSAGKVQPLNPVAKVLSAVQNKVTALAATAAAQIKAL